MAAAFIGVANLALASTTPSVDLEVLADEIEDRNPLATQIARTVSWLGDFPAIAVIALAIFVVIDSAHGTRWIVTRAGAVLLVLQTLFVVLGKQLFGRERPPLDTRLAPEFAPSFPSGHATAMSALAVFTVLCLYWLGWRGVRLGFAVGAAALAVLTIDWARVYLGVHWLTDVTAGTILGTALALTVWLVAVRPHHRAN